MKPLRTLLLLPLAFAAPAAAQQTAPVAPMDWSAHPLSQFTDEELTLPYYLQHFSRFANSVRMDGPDRGFIDIPVWRHAKDNRPYNARIMENALSLAYFYATDRPWNPYHADPAVRARLEAALDFWARSQSPDGRFSEYGPQEWNLAATAFATKFMGETLRLLHGGPPIDSAIHRRAIEADRRAIMAVLQSEDLYEHGRFFSNQYGNVWPGALAYLDLYPDADMRALLDAQFRRAQPDHQSPAGYYYEADGADWAYNLGTHHSNVQMAWSYARGTPMGDQLEEETARWYEWLAYNAALEPDGSGFVLNRAIETRQQATFISRAGQGETGGVFGPAERVEMARIVGPTRESLAASRAAMRAALADGWPRVDTLATGTFSAFSPYAFLHRPHRQWTPSEAEQRAARARLPYLARARFTHQRVDSRKAVSYTFVRRPAYYAAFNAGEAWREQQRYGLGLLWTPEAGAILQSQTGSADAAWGTRSASATAVYEARGVPARFTVGGAAVTPAAGNRDLADGPVVIDYRLGEFGTKRVEFAEEAIRVQVRHTEPFVEHLPLLLLPTDAVEEAPGRLTVRRGGTTIAVTWPAGTRGELRRTELRTGAKEVSVLTLSASGALDYAIEIGGGR
jgi:hypothetical protein